MDIQAVNEGEANALTIRAYLEQVADLTRTHADDLASEIERWAAVSADPRRGEMADEKLYIDRYGGSTEEVRVRLEAFRQVTGVLPERFLELSEPGIGLFETWIASVSDRPSPPSPLDR